MLSALKNFAVTFIIAVLIFGVIAYFATIFVTDTMRSILDNEKEALGEIIQHPEPGESDYESNDDPFGDSTAISGESFDFLILTTDYRPDLYDDYHPQLEKMYLTNWQAQDPVTTLGCLSEDYRQINITSITLVCIDKETQKVAYTYIPLSTRVHTPVGYLTLNEVYLRYGRSDIQNYVYSMTGIEAEYTFVIEGYNLDDLAVTAGETSVMIGKNIYTDGKSNSMQYQSTVYKKDEEGKVYSEIQQNQFLVAQGEVTLDEYHLFHVVSAIEHSASDLDAKKGYVIEIVKKYLMALSSLKDEQLYEAVTTLLMPPSLETDENGEESGDETNAETSFEDTFNYDDYIVDADESETDEPNESHKWKNDVEEPHDAILSTNYTIAEYEKTAQLFRAVAQFEHVTLNFPGTYHSVTPMNEEYYEADVEKAIEMFLPYRPAAPVTH